MFEIEKIAAGGGSSVPVRADDAATPAVGADGTLYWTIPIKGVGGVWEWLIRKARPESGEAVTLVRVNGARVPWEFRAVQPILSPDQKWLAQPPGRWCHHEPVAHRHARRLPAPGHRLRAIARS